MSDRYAPRVRLSSPSAQAAFEASLTFNLLGADQARWIERTKIYCDRLSPFTTQNQFLRILLCQTDPIEFLSGFMAACITGCPVFLGNPNWSTQEWERVLNLVQPHKIWGTLPIPFQPPDPKLADAQEKGWIMIPTGGSSGQIKFAIHTWATLTASAQGFQSFFEVDSINSCCVLPLYHVSGLMQFARSLLTHGQLQIIPFASLLNNHSHKENQSLSSSPLTKGGLRGVVQGVNLSPQNLFQQQYFLSLVPTQLQRLLQQPDRIPWLQQFHTILLGGAPAWPSLLDQAKQHQLNLAPTYGMTETASQVVTLKPQDFLRGQMNTGSTLPHAQIEICDTVGQLSSVGQMGTIVIQSKSLFQGYYPKHSPEATFKTDDLGYFDAQNHLHITGRNSRKIISGGENIFPEEVEIALRSTGLVKDVYVTGLPDDQWGEAVVALYVPENPNITTQMLKDAIENPLSHYKHPKRWLSVGEISRNAQGKVDRGAIAASLKDHNGNVTQPIVPTPGSLVKRIVP
jgi:o-succinylbenzoate---CoA ligase